MGTVLRDLFGTGQRLVAGTLILDKVIHTVAGHLKRHIDIQLSRLAVTGAFLSMK